MAAQLGKLILDLMRVLTSADKAYAALRKAGYTFTRAVVRETWKEVGRKTYWREVLKTWGVHRKPIEAWTVESERLRAARYEMILEVKFIERETGKEFTHRVGYLTNELVSFEEAWRGIAGLREKYEILYNAKAIGYEPFGIIRSIKFE